MPPEMDKVEFKCAFALALRRLANLEAMIILRKSPYYERQDNALTDSFSVQP